MNKYLLIVTAILAVLLFFAGKKIINDSKTIDRIEQAYKVAEDDNKALVLKYNELNKRQKDRINKLSDSLKIKPKFITEYVYIKIRDAITITDTVFIPTTKIVDDFFTFKEDTACFSIEGVINIEDSIPSIAITKYKYDNNSEYLVYLERRKMEWWIFKYKSLRKKDVTLEVISECGTVNVENVKLIK